MYYFFKDFAGPLATVIAAAAAVSVTFYYNKRQFQLSSAQRDIALDKLKFDAWEKRYEIYSQARELASYVAQQHDWEKVYSDKIRTLRIKIDEARFFFGPTVRSLLNEMDKTAENILINLSRRYSYEAEQDEELRNSIIEELVEHSGKISLYYAQMPERFESSLQLSQLARD
jgi:hypothetical protein